MSPRAETKERASWPSNRIQICTISSPPAISCSEKKPYVQNSLRRKPANYQLTSPLLSSPIFCHLQSPKPLHHPTPTIPPRARARKQLHPPLNRPLVSTDLCDLPDLKNHSRTPSHVAVAASKHPACSLGRTAGLADYGSAQHIFKNRVAAPLSVFCTGERRLTVVDGNADFALGMFLGRRAGRNTV